MSDALGLAAHPLVVLPQAGTAGDVQAIEALVQEHQVEALVVGLPLELSGKVGHRAKRVQVLVDALSANFGDSLAVHEWDERFSTAAVERVLIDADLASGHARSASLVTLSPMRERPRRNSSRRMRSCVSS
ncbi:MAG: Holliday junction resolvase RuvX [Myxococcales bacterium]|nr:Holliday junction resolvase RuvX [Myxococcales bacterium]